MSVSNERESQLLAFGSAIILGVTGLVVGALLGAIFFALLSSLVTIQRGSGLSQSIALVAQGVGLVGVGAVYLSMRQLPLDYLRMRWPSLRDVAWAVAATLCLFAAIVALTFVIQQLGLSASSHSVAEQGQKNPSVLLPLIPLSVLITGPAEEFLYRGIIQSRLKEVFGAGGAVLLAASIFSLVHVPSYGLTSGLSWSLVTSLGLIFALGAVLGAVYEYTDNLIVPAVAHGIYNAVVFGSVFVRSTGGL